MIAYETALEARRYRVETVGRFVDRNRQFKATTPLLQPSPGTDHWSKGRRVSCIPAAPRHCRCPQRASRGSGSAYRAASAGGGIDNFGTLTVTSSTISGNSAAIDGGGIDTSGQLTHSRNNIIAGNKIGR